MSSKKICVGSLISYKDRYELISYDIVCRIHCAHDSNQIEVPVYYYRTLRPNKAYICSYIKFIQ